MITSRRKKYCDYYDEAGFECQTAQDDHGEAQDFAAMMRVDAQCIRCDEPAGWKGQGRPRRYCSNRCKQADYRSRRAWTAQAA
ncbi:hypothetical protein [Streptomyces sp. SID3343]|uniref:hypothetical protein n=1 Tax=Streptomyces sp. SID3343 TaxID=2690260 RepID=UPI001369A2C1|nr:hypothetical protein [Streptomyces sp. SID3343]MYW05762.1 hypothetical protein [Streptomyces sp. SID3343]